MIINKNNFTDLPKLIVFHQEKHKSLSISIISKMTGILDFKLKIQKASIQFLNPKPFAVIGSRGNQEYIFIEFYNENKIALGRIVKTVKGNNSLFINRVNIANECDIDAELVEFIIYSNHILNKNKD